MGPPAKGKPLAPSHRDEFANSLRCERNPNYFVAVHSGVDALCRMNSARTDTRTNGRALVISATVLSLIHPARDRSWLVVMDPDSGV